MGAPYLLTKRFTNHFGLDLKSSDLNRPEVYASGMMNAQYRKSGALEKRVGYQPFAPDQGGFGLISYDRINDSGIPTPECIAVGQYIYKLNITTLTVSYAGAELQALLDVFFDPSSGVYKAQIVEGTTTVLDYSLGTGFDEGTIITVNNLKTQIDALSGFSSTFSGNGTAPAAFIKPVRNHNLVISDSDLMAGSWSQVNSTATNPLAGSETHKNDEDFENVTYVQLNNVLYISNGYDYVHKYDGQTFYRAGLPTPASLTSALGGAGAITGSNYYHKAQYIQVDNSGNVIEGNLFRTATGLAPAAQSINVTVANVQAGTGFNTNCAIVAGAQAAVNTITVDNGSGGSHTMKVGDTAYFYDAVSASYVEREVTAIAATTITVAGAAVTVADNAVISNNLRIGLYRNQTSATTPTVFYLVAEIPNNSFASTQVFNDNLADASLGAVLIEPTTDRSAPPKGKYLSSFRTQMVVTGAYEAPNTVYWSDIDGPEYFPNTGSHQIDVSSQTGSIISGCSQNNEVFTVFQAIGIHVISGDISTGNIRVDQISTDLGCVSHHSIKEIKGVLFFLSQVGPRLMIGGQLPLPIGQSIGDNQGKSSRIDPVFDQVGVDTTEKYILKRSIGFHDRKGEKYWLYLPAESVTSGDNHANSNSVVYVYDYTRDAWLKWNNINLAAGIAQVGDYLYFSERRYSTFNSDVDHVLYRQRDQADAWDYQDHTSAIDWEYVTQWEFLGEPAIPKKYLRIKVFNLEEIANNEFEIGVQTEVDFTEEVKADFVFDNISSGYGVSEYGEASYGDPGGVTRKHKLSTGKFYALRTRFHNANDQENIVLSGWEYEIVAPFRPAVKE